MQLLGFSRTRQKQRCEELLNQFKIEHIRKTKAGKLSGGERRRLEIARCLVSDPKIIMLDEPFAGIDPVTVQSIQVIIRHLADDGIAILITDHAAREILQITDRTYVVSEGQILVSGTSDTIVQNEIVRSKYLGDISFVKEQNPVAIPRNVAPTQDLVEQAQESVAAQDPDATPQPQRADEAHGQQPAIRFSSRSAKAGKVRLKSTDLD